MSNIQLNIPLQNALAAFVETLCSYVAFTMQRTGLQALLVSITAVGIAAQSGGPIGIYNSSHTPSSLPWNTYNYCNAPHVNVAHYTRPSQPAELVYMNVMTRHHKVSVIVIV